MAGSGGCWPALDQVGAGPQLKELDEINPESLRTDVTPAAYRHGGRQRGVGLQRGIGRLHGAGGQCAR